MYLEGSLKGKGVGALWAVGRAIVFIRFDGLSKEQCVGALGAVGFPVVIIRSKGFVKGKGVGIVSAVECMFLMNWNVFFETACCDVAVWQESKFM